MIILLGLNTCDRYATIHGKTSAKHQRKNFVRSYNLGHNIMELFNVLVQI